MRFPLLESQLPLESGVYEKGRPIHTGGPTILELDLDRAAIPVDLC
jgi:hypothetical protein